MHTMYQPYIRFINNSSAWKILKYSPVNPNESSREFAKTCKHYIHSSIDLDVFPCQIVPHSGLWNSPYPHQVFRPPIADSIDAIEFSLLPQYHIPPKHENPSATRICKIYKFNPVKWQRGPTIPSELTIVRWFICHDVVRYSSLVHHLRSINPWYSKLQGMFPRLCGPEIVCFPMLSLLSLYAFPHGFVHKSYIILFNSFETSQKLRVLPSVSL